jgi:FKBP-type peptidyl-prolyl cis-trans isomerase FklB
MRQINFTILILALFCATAVASDQLDLNNEKNRLSYSTGYQVGSDSKNQKMDINPYILLQGVLDALAEREPLMTRKEMQTTLTELQKQIVELQNKEKKEDPTIKY